jgi:autotransporter-associated beta strand protein
MVLTGDNSDFSGSVNIAQGTLLFQGVQKVRNLAVSEAGRIDVGSGSLIFAAADLGSFNGGGYTGILGLIASGRGDGSWNGTGLVTSDPDATVNGRTTLAVARAEDIGYAGGTFGGQNVNRGDVIVFYTWGGDADLNGELNGDDYFFIDSNILTQNPGFNNGDFDYNGEINGDDYFVIDSNITFAQNSPPFVPGASAASGLSELTAPSHAVAGITAVPEPSSLVLTLPAMLLARRRRARAPRH